MRHQMTSMSIGGEHTAASRRRLRQMVAKNSMVKSRVEVDEEHKTSVHDGGINFGKAPARNKQNAGDADEER